MSQDQNPASSAASSSSFNISNPEQIETILSDLIRKGKNHNEIYINLTEFTSRTSIEIIFGETNKILEWENGLKTRYFLSSYISRFIAYAILDHALTHPDFFIECLNYLPTLVNLDDSVRFSEHPFNRKLSRPFQALIFFYWNFNKLDANTLFIKIKEFISLEDEMHHDFNLGLSQFIEMLLKQISHLHYINKVHKIQLINQIKNILEFIDAHLQTDWQDIFELQKENKKNIQVIDEKPNNSIMSLKGLTANLIHSHGFFQSTEQIEKINKLPDEFQDLIKSPEQMLALENILSFYKKKLYQILNKHQGGHTLELENTLYNIFKLEQLVQQDTVIKKTKEELEKMPKNIGSTDLCLYQKTNYIFAEVCFDAASFSLNILNNQLLFTTIMNIYYKHVEPLKIREKDYEIKNRQYTHRFNLKYKHIIETYHSQSKNNPSMNLCYMLYNVIYPAISSNDVNTLKDCYAALDSESLNDEYQRSGISSLSRAVKFNASNQVITTILEHHTPTVIAYMIFMGDILCGLVANNNLRILQLLIDNTLLDEHFYIEYPRLVLYSGDCSTLLCFACARLSTCDDSGLVMIDYLLSRKDKLGITSILNTVNTDNEGPLHVIIEKWSEPYEDDDEDDAPQKNWDVFIRIIKTLCEHGVDPYLDIDEDEEYESAFDLLDRRDNIPTEIKNTCKEIMLSYKSLPDEDTVETSSFSCRRFGT